MPHRSDDTSPPSPHPEAARAKNTGPDLFTLGAAGAFLGAMVVVGLPLWRKAQNGSPASQSGPVPVFDPSPLDLLDTPSVHGEDEPHADPEVRSPDETPSSPGAKLVESLCAETPSQLSAENAFPFESETAPASDQDHPASYPEPDSDTVSIDESARIPLEELAASALRFQPGEIVRKSKSLRGRVLDPHLGVVLDVYSGYEPVTYKIQFFDADGGRRDIYWEEDLVKLNPREKLLYLQRYPEAVQQKIQKSSLRSAGRNI
ncbi:MAG: hypothetical protein KY468_09305 [Armatimonadetes bacterium]|nr:hypothetical protein [Armatimonadota bacterium]